MSNKFYIENNNLIIENFIMLGKIKISSIDDIIISRIYPKNKYRIFIFFTNPVEYDAKKGFFNKIIYSIFKNNNNPMEIKRVYYDSDTEQLLNTIKQILPLANIPNIKDSLFWKTEDENTNFKRTKLVYSREGFGLSLVCEAGGEEPIEVSTAISEKVRKTFSPIFGIIDFLDNLLGISEAKTEDRAKASNVNYIKRNGLRTLPISFEIKPPSLGIGIGIGYEPTSNREISWGIEGRLLANPIVAANIRLDLLALGSKIKPWGFILDVLDIAAWATETFSGGKLEVDYKLDIVFESEINICGKKNRGRS